MVEVQEVEGQEGEERIHPEVVVQGVAPQGPSLKTAWWGVAPKRSGWAKAETWAMAQPHQRRGLVAPGWPRGAYRRA